MHPRTKQLLTETLLTVEELSAYTGIKRNTILQRAFRGSADYVKKGNQLLFDKRDFTAKSDGTFSARCGVTERQS